MATDEFDEPLGRAPKRKRLNLPFGAPQVLATVLGLAVVVVALWTVFASDPFGGEPVAIVATVPSSAAGATDQGVAAAARNQRGPTINTATAPAAPVPPPGSSTINIIDGSSGKSQQVVVPAKPGSLPGPSGALPGSAPGAAVPLPGAGPNANAAAHGDKPAALTDKAPADPRLIEQSRHGAIPKVGPDGARPALVYARPVKIAPDKAGAPRIAIVVGGLGVSAAATADALTKLPAPVTLAFMPYGANLDHLAAQARAENHEVLLQAPMEPFDYPDNDPGPQTLLTSLSADQNVDRLQWLMSRMQGFVGIASYMGARFAASEQAMAPVLRETAKRGLLFVDDAASPRSVAGQIAGSQSLPFAKVEVVVDATPTRHAVEQALARLELMARDRGSAVGYATALPATIAQIAEWAKAATARGFVLVPISMIAIKTKSS
jgi:polysaccharide deacetylase 2 family uncharacterized protein YibQ